MTTSRHPLSLSDLDLLETETLMDLLAKLENANKHLHLSNEHMRAEQDAEMEEFVKENEDLVARQEETMQRAKQVLQKRLGVSPSNPHYAPMPDPPPIATTTSEPQTSLTAEMEVETGAGLYL